MKHFLLMILIAIAVITSASVNNYGISSERDLKYYAIIEAFKKPIVLISKSEDTLFKGLWNIAIKDGNGQIYTIGCMLSYSYYVAKKFNTNDTIYK